MRPSIRAGLLAAQLVVALYLCGCGGKPTTNCEISVVIAVSPTSAVANHAASPPGNQVQFIATASPTAPPGCAVPTWIAKAYGTWANPDPIAIQISSANDATNGTAVCKAATNGAVTLTGTFTQLVPAPVTKTVQLTCN